MSMPLQIISASSHSWKFGILRSLIILVLAMGVTLQCISVSRKIGRLSSVPNYDDCTYLLSASLLNYKWKQGDLAGILQTLQHSPYSVGLAAVAFAILGNQDESAYQANVVVILAYLAALSWILRGVPFFPWLLSLLILLNLPIVKMGVVEFRPDIFCSICIGFGVLYTLTSPQLLENRRDAFFTGVIFAAAYLAKPSIFFLTTIVLLASLFGRCVHSWIFRHVSGVKPSDLWWSAGIIGSTVVFLAGWYYVVFGAYISSYFYENSFGINKSIWTFRGDWLTAMSYYLGGSAAKSSMGTLGALIFLFATALANWRFSTALNKEKIRCLFLFAICFLIYLINTLGGMKSQFLGASLYMSIIFVGAYLLNSFYLHYYDQLKVRQAVNGCILVFAFATLLFFREWPPYSDWRTEGGKVRPYYNEATMGFTKILQSINPHPTSILFTHSGPIVPEAIGIWMLRHHQKKLNFQSAAFVRNMDDFHKMQQIADMIVIPTTNTVGLNARLPIQMVVPHIWEELASHPKFRLYQTIPITEGGEVYVYMRNEI